MKEDHPEPSEERLARALAHPVRIRILEILSQRVASPKMISAELETGLSHVAYHTRVLERSGCLELVQTARRQGGAERFYKAKPPAAKASRSCRGEKTLDWLPLRLDERGWREVAAILRKAGERVREVQERSSGRNGPREDGSGTISAVVAMAFFEVGASRPAGEAP